MTHTPETNKKRLCVQVYMTEAERAAIGGELDRINARRSKKISMADLLRKKVFTSAIRETDTRATDQGSAPLAAADIERIIDAVVIKIKDEQSLVSGEAEKIVGLVEQAIERNMEAVRRDILDLKDDLRQFTNLSTKKPWDK
jgi:uncharacterized membrane protein